jgi:quinol monooxygenase YgiN
MKNTLLFLALAVPFALSTTQAAGQIRRNTGLLHRANEACPVVAVLCTAQLPIRPESREGFLAATAAWGEQVRREKGCRDFRVYEAPGSPGTFFLLEEWATEADLAAHRRQPTQRAYQRQIQALLAAPAAATTYQVSARQATALVPANR